MRPFPQLLTLQCIILTIQKCVRDLTCRSRDTLEQDRNLRGMEGMKDEMSRGQENSRMF